MEGGTRVPESLQPLEPAPALRHRIHEQLENLISTGVFEPGARLVESDLAQTLGVSRGPIREALQLLARDGFVDLRPRQVAFVHVPTAKEVDDFFGVRRALETGAARLAAARVTPEGAEQLRAALDSGYEALDRGEDPSRRRAGPEFHEVVTMIADNAILARMLATLNKRAAWYLPPFDPSHRRAEWQQHGVIVEAIAAGDPDRAAEAMSAHVQASWEAYKRLPARP